MTISDGMLRPAAGMGEGGILFTASLRASQASLRGGRWSSIVVPVTRASSPSLTVIVVRDGDRSSAATGACLVASWGHDGALDGL